MIISICQDAFVKRKYTKISVSANPINNEMFNVVLFFRVQKAKSYNPKPTYDNKLKATHTVTIDF
jgi:hypothetical protein